jgi:anti-sigma regulatory factor (Ser/Thr protein kinase)
VRSGAAAGHSGYFHEAGFYRSDDELVSMVVPFLAEGVAQGEPVVITLDDEHAELVRRAVPDTAGMTFLPAPDPSTRPASFIRGCLEVFADHVAAGAGQIRTVGDIPHPGVGASWDGWARYEAVVNHAFDDFPVWGLCLYDMRSTPDEVVTDVCRTHPRVATAAGDHVANDGYESPTIFLSERTGPEPDPLESTVPMLELVDPTPAAARHGVHAVGEQSTLSRAEVDDLVTGVSEAVSNAVLFGKPPVTVRAWHGPGRLLVAVHDQGQGPGDPFVGLIPADKAVGHGGLGLWIAHQMCTQVTLDATDTGFTVRLVAGLPHVANGAPL